MGILDEDVARVREAADLAALVGQYTQLKRVGRRQVGLCPFHAERTPSFTVNPEMGVYLCFGCQAKGDAITFVRETEHLDFVGSPCATPTSARGRDGVGGPVWSTPWPRRSTGTTSGS
jgi:DNA primase